MPTKKTAKPAAKTASIGKKTKSAAKEKPAQNTKKKIEEALPKTTLKPKKQVIAEFKTHEKDTGSATVQIAIISARIQQLTEHLKEHPKDNHSRRGLLGMVSKRRKLLAYLKKKDKDGYETLLEKTGLRG